MENKLPKCYIFDIDGTVAQRTNRHHFDWTAVGTDIPKENIQKIYQIINEYYGSGSNEYACFFFITGRDEFCRKDTEEWLKKYNFRYDGLFMRPLGNKDRDTDIKLRHYKEHIEGKYEVIAVFEDRSRCVELFRDHLKLTVLQVENGRY